MSFQNNGLLGDGKPGQGQSLAPRQAAHPAFMPWSWSLFGPTWVSGFIHQSYDLNSSESITERQIHLQNLNKTWFLHL